MHELATGNQNVPAAQSGFSLARTWAAAVLAGAAAGAPSLVRLKDSSGLALA